MSPTSHELDAMRRAITLSAHGIATTSPNPPVGCVILDADGAIVGEGYHARKGESHAEVNALRAAGQRANGGTAAVTLEPCNHYGRTPPCHQALLDAGVRRVLIALIDPTSRGEGGARRLLDAGVDVEIGVLDDEARLVLGPWLVAQTRGRPVVTWAYAIDDTGLVPLSDEALSVCRATDQFDVILDDHGAREPNPGSHGLGVFNVPDVLPTNDPDASLKALYAGGCRTVLVNGDERFARPFVDSGHVSRIYVYFADVEPSASPGGAKRLFPDGFHLVRVRRSAGAILAEATHVEAQATGPER